MLNYRVIAIIKRELRERALSKSFIFTTILFPALMFGFIGLQAFLMSFEGDSGVKLEVISENENLAWKLQKEFGDRQFVKDGSYSIIFSTMDSSSFKQYLNEKRKDIIEEKLTGIVYAPNSALTEKKVEYYSKTPKNMQITGRLSRAFNKALVEEYFSGKNISEEDLAYARKNVDIASYKVTKEEGIKEEGYGNLALAYLFTFLLYISLLMMGSQTLQMVIQEKSNRINEILLSSVSSKELMIGKILGASITGALQMAIWLSPLMLVVSTSWFVLPQELTFSITMGQIIYLIINFFLGLLIFIGLFAAVGSIFENPQDAQSGMWPIMLLIIVPFFIAFSMMKNPTNPIAEIASLAPFSSVIVMPPRMTLVDVPVWQMALSVVVNLATLIAIFPIAGKIYRIGILRTGKKPSWGEVLKWLTYKY